MQSMAMTCPAAFLEEEARLEDFERKTNEAPGDASRAALSLVD